MNNGKIDNRIKILFVHHGKGIGGASLSLLYLTSNLDKTRFQPIVLFMADSEAVELFKNNNIQTLGPINRSDFSHTKIWWFRVYHVHHLVKACFDSFKLLFGQANTILNKIKPDIIHLNTSSLFAWAICAKRLKIPVVWHIREPLSSGYFGLRKKLTTLAVEKFSNVIVPICKNDAQPWQKCPKTQIVYNAVPADKFRQKASTKSPEQSVLFLGGLSLEKGTLLLLQAFGKVLEIAPQANLIIAGNWSPKVGIFGTNFGLTPWHFYCKKTLKELDKIKAFVQILGVCKNVEDLINSATLLVSPFTVGHFSRPVIEAGFLAKPVVASNLPPFDELIKNGQTGLLFDPKNVQDLANKILEILMSPELAYKLGKNAKIFCTKKFGLQNQIAKISKIYQDLL